MRGLIRCSNRHQGDTHRQAGRQMVSQTGDMRCRLLLFVGNEGFVEKAVASVLRRHHM